MIDFVGSPEPGSRRPNSRATKAAGLVFVSGSSAPHDPARGIYRGDTAVEQVRHSLSYIAEVLSTAGSGLERVVQITMLITDPADYDACNAEYVKHFPGGLPARQTARFGVRQRPRSRSHALLWSQNEARWPNSRSSDVGPSSARRSAAYPAAASHLAPLRSSARPAS